METLWPCVRYYLPACNNQHRMSRDIHFINKLLSRYSIHNWFLPQVIPIQNEPNICIVIVFNIQYMSQMVKLNALRNFVWMTSWNHNQYMQCSYKPKWYLSTFFNARTETYVMCRGFPCHPLPTVPKHFIMLQDIANWYLS